jgi:hypothetical protein
MSTRDHPQSDGQTENANGILEDALRHFVESYQRDDSDDTSASVASKFLGNWEEQVSKAKTFYAIAQQRYQQYADKHCRPSPDYKPGDQVLLNTKFFQLTPGLSHKLAPRWVGPFTVKEVLHPHKLAVRLDLPSRAKLMHPVFHVSALPPYHTSGNYQPPRLPDCIE